MPLTPFMMKEWARAMVRDLVSLYTPYYSNLIVLITVRRNHVVKRSPTFTDVRSNKSQVFGCSMSSSHFYIHSGSCTFTVGRIGIGIDFTNPFQLRIYCSDTILSESSFAYYSNPFPNRDSKSDHFFTNSTFADYEHTLKAFSFPQVC